MTNDVREHTANTHHPRMYKAAFDACIQHSGINRANRSEFWQLKSR